MNKNVMAGINSKKPAYFRGGKWRKFMNESEFEKSNTQKKLYRLYDTNHIDTTNTLLWGAQLPSEHN
jgi:hypothetical protein